MRYVIVGITLLVFTGITVALSYVDFGTRKANIAVAMLVLSSEQARWVILAMSAVAGLGTLGTQNLVNGYVAHFYPARLRGSALGVCLGLGRFGSILGPSYVTLVIALFATPAAGFYGFVLPAVLGAIAIAMVPAVRRPVATGPVGAARASGEAR